MEKLLVLLFLLFVLASCNNPFDNVINNDNNNTENNNNQENAEKNINTTITIIEMNDVHGYIMQDENKMLGLSNMAYLIDKIRQEKGEDHVLTIANGDMFQGTGLVKMSYGEVMIDALSEMKLDACCLGNHEFDWDLPVITKYFDGDKANGEANFPLINSNVYQDGKLLIDDNIFETYMFEKAGLKIGFIGYIGDVKGSINALFANKYEFDCNFSTITKKLATKLKQNGADIIVVSIHDGASGNNVQNFEFNKIVANLKGDDGNYLIDAVINGHTHYYQEGYISRPNGPAMPVVQSSGYNSGYLYSFGRIDLTIENNKVVSSNVSHLTAKSAGTNCNKGVQDIIDQYYEKDKDILETVFTTSTSFISRYDSNTYDWVSNVMLAATGADIVICNTGGLRTNINSGEIKFEDMYQFNPFDNKIIMHEVDAYLVNNFLDNNSDYYFWNYKDYKKTSGTYTVAIIDYVYYSTYYRNVRTQKYYNTELILRNLLIEDLSLRKTFNVATDKEARIGLKVEKIIYTTSQFTYIDDKYYFIFV